MNELESVLSTKFAIKFDDLLLGPGQLDSIRRRQPSHHKGLHFRHVLGHIRLLKLSKANHSTQKSRFR